MNSVILAKHSEDIGLIKQVIMDYHITIPDVIIEFLKKNNRGAPKKKGLSGIKSTIFVTRFISIWPNDKVNIVSLAKEINDRNHDCTYIPIALDGYGNVFCMMYENEYRYSIVFLLRDNMTIIPICRSFSDFLGMMALQT